MSTKKRATNPIISDLDPYQTIENCRSVIEYMATAVHENGVSDFQTFGRYFICLSVNAALEHAQAELQKPELAAVS